MHCSRAFLAALAASACLVAPLDIAFAADADAVAKALGAALARGQTTGATFEAASEDGGNVVITGLSFAQSEGQGRVRFANTIVESPAEAGGGGFTASGVTMKDGVIEGETSGTVASAELGSVTILPAETIASQNLGHGLLYDEATASGIAIKPKDQTEPMNIERVSIKTGNVVDNVPQESSGTAEGIALPASYFAGAQMTPQMLGYDKLTFDVAWDGARDPQSGLLTIDEAKLSLREGGELSLFGKIGNVPLNQPEGADSSAAAAAVTVESLTLRYVDQSLAARILDNVAKMQGVTREQYAQQLSAALPFFLGALNNPTFQNEVAGAVGAFLQNPKSLTVSVAPQTPVSGAQIMTILGSAPQTLPETLNVTIKANGE